MAPLTKVLLFVFGLLAFAHAVQIPAPMYGQDHWFGTGIYTTELSNPNAPDPVNPANFRKLQLTLFYPIENTSCTSWCPISYMQSKVSSAASAQFSTSEDFFAGVDLTACCASPAVHYPNKTAIVVLEPAVGTSRLVYSALAQRIASAGFAVMTIDHPYDSSIIAYSSGTEVHGNIELDPFLPLSAWNDTVANALTARISDIYFVLEQLADISVVGKLIDNLDVRTAFNTSARMAVVGHGLGGTVATYFGIADDRCTVSVNMGGTPPPMFSDTYKNFVYFGNDPQTRRVNDILWSEVWKHFRNKATEWDMKNSSVYDFSDLEKIAKVKGATQLPKGIGSVGVAGFESAAAIVESYLLMEWRPLKRGDYLRDAMADFPALQPYEPRTDGA